MPAIANKGDGGQHQTIAHDLMYGIETKHIRFLCSNAWEGGFGYDPEQVGNLTIDEIYVLLVDKKELRGASGSGARTVQVDSAAALADKDGYVKGRDVNGNPLRLKVTGKSMVQMVRERNAAKKLESKIEPGWKKRARRRAERRASRTKETG